MLTNWTVAPEGPGSSATVKATWTGACGMKGFFEKTFAPQGLKKVQSQVLANRPSLIPWSVWKRRRPPAE